MNVSLAKASASDPALAGSSLILSAALLFGLFDVCIKALGQPFTAWDIAVFRSGFGLLAMSAILGRHGNPFRGRRTGLLLVRGVVGSIAFLTTTTAFLLIPLSTALVLYFSFPAFTALFSAFIFKAPITRSEVISIGAAIAGIAVFFDARLEGMFLGQVMAVIGAVFCGLAIAIIKRLRDDHNAGVIYLYFCALMVVISVPVFIRDPHIPATPAQWGLIVGIMIFGSIAQILMNQGLRYCKSWQGGVLLMFECVSASALSVLLFGDPLTWRFFAGGGLILGSAVALNLCTGAPPCEPPDTRS